MPVDDLDHLADLIRKPVVLLFGQDQRFRIFRPRRQAHAAILRIARDLKPVAAGQLSR